MMVSSAKSFTVELFASGQPGEACKVSLQTWFGLPKGPFSVYRIRIRMFIYLIHIQYTLSHY